jgi:type I restriction enzyme M protein
MTKEQLKQLEADLWSAADNLRANSDLKSSEYSTPVLGLIFLKFADNNYRRHEAAILAEHQKLKGTRREKPLSEIAIEKCGFYLPDHARYDYLLNLPEEKNIAKALKEAMKAIEEYKPELEGVLPKDEYFRLTRDEKTRTIPNQLLKNFANIPVDTTGDLFGQIYEYFLAEFARSEGQKGGEFFTPRSVVRLMVEIVEPHGGKVFDPACGSGGMFVQSAHFIEEHRKELSGNANSGVYVYGQEKTLETVNLAKMNLAVNGLRGEIKKANTYYDDPHGSFGAFDYVLANPPFNVDDVSLSSVEKDKRFSTYGIPRKKSKAKKSEQGKETVPKRELPLDHSLRHLAQAKRPRRARHGQFRLRRAPLRGRHPPDVDGKEPHLRRADVAFEHVLHGDPAGHALVFRQGQGGRPHPLHRCPQHLHPDRPRPPRVLRRADPEHRHHQPAPKRPTGKVRPAC